MHARLFGFVLTGCLLASTHAGAQYVTIAPGVELLERTDPGPNRVRALRVNLCAAGVRIQATRSGDRGKRTSTWGSAVGAVAAVNGGFFLSGFRPDQGAAVGGGAAWPDSTETGVRAWFGVGRHRLHHSPGPEIMPPPAWVEEAVNGDATLVQDGRAINCGGCGGGRAPRSAVGYSANRRQLFLVTVDGRSSSSRGMTIDEFAVLLDGFANIDRAMNLDGGGSTTMWVRGRGLVNRPSDGSERTVANHLGVFASGSGRAWQCPDAYGATFGRSTFPGELVVRGEVGTTVDGTLRFRNTGTIAWDGQTKLAPAPRDRASPLAHSSWLSPTRVVASGPVAAGAVHAFPFTIQIPNTAGETVQSFTILRESVTWFGDALGPADNAVRMRVIAEPKPAWRARFVRVLVREVQGRNQTFDAEVGERVRVRVEMENTGRSAWPRDMVRVGTTEPRDRMSELADGWLGTNRPAKNERAVAPGERYTFEFFLRAPRAGTFVEHFGFVHEGVSWFSRSGGPADDEIQLTMRATDPPPPPMDAGMDTGRPDVGTDSGADAGTDAGGADVGTDSSSDTGGPNPDVGTDTGTTMDSGADSGQDSGTADSATDSGTSDASSDTMMSGDTLDGSADGDPFDAGDTGDLEPGCDCHVASGGRAPLLPMVMLLGLLFVRRRSRR